MKATKNYEEVQELAKNLDAVDNGDMGALISVILYHVSERYGDSNAFILEKLTGLDLSTEEKLYDYFSKTVDLENKEVAELAINFLRDL
jgi:hypothetical protein